jgi:hypothetical protein
MTKNPEDFCAIFKLLERETNNDDCKDYLTKTQGLLKEFKDDNDTQFLNAIKDLSQEQKHSLEICINRIFEDNNTTQSKYGSIFSDKSFIQTCDDLLNYLLDIINSEKSSKLTSSIIPEKTTNREYSILFIS